MTRPHAFLFSAVFPKAFDKNGFDYEERKVHWEEYRIIDTNPRIGVSQEALSTSPICRCCLRKFSLRILDYIETGVINSQRLSLQVTIADVNYYSALRTPADFETILHVKFPTSKSRQIGSRFLDRVK